MGKKLCEEKDMTFSKKDTESKYYCKSCGAEAKKEKHLCKPKRNN